MKLLAIYDDPFYADEGIDSLRFTARVFLRDEVNRFAFLRIFGEDGFGHRNHLESAGGGVEEGESFLQAAQREVMEELGVVAQDFDLIGLVIDEYHLLKRMTCSVYFAARLVSKNGPTNRTEEEKLLIAKIEWLTPDEVMKILSVAVSPVDNLVHRRELTAFTHYLSQASSH
jgi:8-oxo-dGTP diphosphatase